MKTKESLLYKIVRPIITIGFKCLYKPKIIGKENIPKDGKIILAGNHTNNFDCLLLISSTKRPIHFLAKDELWKGFKKIIFSNLGLIPVNRRTKDHNALVLAEQYLLDNKVIGIFPEGTTEKEVGKMLPFKIGAIKMASDTNSMIVPFGISGEYKLFSKDLKLCFGEPIEIKNNDLEIEKTRLESLVSELMKGE